MPPYAKAISRPSLNDRHSSLQSESGLLRVLSVRTTLIARPANVRLSEARRRDIARARAGGVAEDDELALGDPKLGPRLAEVVDWVRRRVGRKGDPEGCIMGVYRLVPFSFLKVVGVDGQG